MEFIYQIMMGLSLAACAGFRAWLPLFVMGIMARTGHISLNPSLQFLTTDHMLIIFGVAAMLEFLGDKIIVIDHFLDAVGTVARPIAGALLTSSMLTHVDPGIAMILGLIVGGGTALTLHTGKAVVRAKSTLFAPLHGGLGNAALSFGEDAMSGLGSVLAIFAPVIAFVIAICMMGVAAVFIVIGFKAGKSLFGAIARKQAPNNSNALPAQDVLNADPGIKLETP